MRPRLLAPVAALFILVAAVPAEAGSARLPEPLVAHLRVASPQKFLEAFDAVLGTSVKGTPAAANIPPGVFSLMLVAASPLPVAAWNTYADAHFLVLPDAREVFAAAVVIESEGLEAISEALRDKGEMTLDRGRKTLVAKLNQHRDSYCFQELSGGRVLIAKDADLADRFQAVLKDWTPRLESDSAVACQMDLLNLQAAFQGEIGRGFADLRKQMGLARTELANRATLGQGQIDPEDLELLKNFCEDALDAGDRLITETEALLPMLGGLRLEVDAANGRLLLNASLTGAKDSRLDRYVAELGGQANPDFPFVEAFPARSLYYFYQGADGTESGASLRDFARDLVHQLLARTSPATAAEIDGIVEAARKAGLRSTGGAAYTNENGDVPSAVYTAWDRPDDVLPLVKRVAGLADGLNAKGMALFDKYFRRLMAEADGAEAEDNPLARWKENLLREGVKPVVEPRLASDGGEAYGVPYASLIVGLNFDQFIPPGLDQLTEVKTVLARMHAIEDSLKFLWVRWKDAVVFSHGVLDPDNLEREIADITEPVPEGGATFAGLLRKDEYVKAIAHRQSGFSMARPSQTFARALIDHVRQTLAGDEDAQARAWEVFNGMEENDTFIYVWSGVEDGGVRVSLLFPAESINNLVRNVYRQQDNLTVLLVKIYAASRAGRPY